MFIYISHIPWLLQQLYNTFETILFEAAGQNEVIGE